MQNLVAFKYLLQWLGLLYAAEGRPGGDAAASALLAFCGYISRRWVHGVGYTLAFWHRRRSLWSAERTAQIMIEIQLADAG